MAFSLAFGDGGSARAGDSDGLIRDGIEQRRRGNDEEALQLFKRAYEIDRGARSVAQMGLAEQALGMWTDAEAHIRAALARDKDPWIQKNRAAIRKALDVVTSHLGSLDVSGTPAGAEVLIAGQLAGTLPLQAPLRVTAGTVTITVRSPGFVESSRTTEVTAGGTFRERFTLPRRAAPPTVAQLQAPEPAGTSPAPPKPMTADLRAGSDAGPAPEPSSGSVFKRWWFWTLVGAAAAGGVTAFVLLRRSDCVSGSMCATISIPPGAMQ